jgi:hypothetical protein
MPYHSYTTNDMSLGVSVGPDVKRTVTIPVLNKAELGQFLVVGFASLHAIVPGHTSMGARVQRAKEQWEELYGEPADFTNWNVFEIRVKGTCVKDRLGEVKDMTWGLVLGDSRSTFAVAWEE